MAKYSTKEDGRPAFQFYPKDWLASADLSVCSLAAQGLWIKLLCFMFTSPKRGVLLLSSGNKMDSKTIAKLCGEKEDIITALLMELETTGVLSINEGIISNRRMVRDQELSQIRSAAGLKGLSKRWHKKYSKTIAKGIAKPLQTAGEAKEVAVEIEEGKAVMLEEIINYLNLTTGKHYKLTTPKTKDFIKLRMAEGFSVQNFKTVIDNQAREWGNDHKMAQYLRPETLFGTKFESYLNATIIKKQEDGDY